MRGIGLSLSIAVIATIMLVAPTQAAQLNTQSTLIDETPPPTIPDAAPQFTKVIDDLPLMPGLELVPDKDVLFIAPPNGRIAETTAKGIVDVDDVYKFYRRSLPGLGWKALDARSWQRSNDMLRIDAHAEEKTTIVRFSVKPTSSDK